MAIVIPLVQGDTRPTIKVTIFDEFKPDESFNISGTSILLKVRVLDVPGITSTLTGTILDGLRGIVVFDFEPDTLQEDGEYEAEIEITYPSGDVHTVYDKIYFAVREEH